MTFGSYHDLKSGYWSIDLLPTIQLVGDEETGDRVLVLSFLSWWLAFEV